MKKPARVAIIGGGIAGLAAAYSLENSSVSSCDDLEIDLLEANAVPGGKLRTVQRDGMRMELGAESFLSRKAPGIEFCQALEIADQLRGTRPENKKTFIWHGGKMHRLPEGLSGFVPGNLASLFSTSLLSLGGKLRAAADFVIPASRSKDDESLASFMTRRLGKQTYQRMVQPLLCGIYSGDGARLSLAATYPELRKLETEHGSLIRGLRRRQQSRSTDQDESWPPFVTLPGGMSDLVDTVIRRLKQTRIHLDCPAGRMRREHNGWQIETGDSGTGISGKSFDAVIVASSARIASSIVDGVDSDLGSVLGDIPHVSIATVNLWFEARRMDHSLDGYGFVIPSREQRGVTAVTWTSSKHYDRAPDGLKLIRAYLGRAGAELDSSVTDDEIMNIVGRQLKRTMGISCPPVGHIIQRWPNGSPQYTLGHNDKLNQIEQKLKRHPGLYLCGASYRGVGIPDCIRESRKVAEKVHHHLTIRKP